MTQFCEARRRRWPRCRPVLAALILATGISAAADSPQSGGGKPVAAEKSAAAGGATAATPVDPAAVKRLADATRFLASDPLEGRGLGTAGINLAADYLAGKFREIGLKTDLYDGRPFQNFMLTLGSKLGPKIENTAEIDGPTKPDSKQPAVVHLKLGDDFNPLALGGSQKFDLPLVFVGYGITGKIEKYDDYAGIDAKDKAVIILRHQPQRSAEHGLFGKADSPFAPLSRKVSNAYEHGAAAVIFITDEEEIRRNVTKAESRVQEAVDQLVAADTEFKKIKDPTVTQIDAHSRKLAELADQITKRRQRVAEQLDSVLPFDRAGDEGDSHNIPVLHVLRSALDPAVKAALGVDLAALELKIDETGKPQSRGLGEWHIKGETDLIRTPTPVKNVLGEIEGVGPHADETIVIGAHYDHLGYGGPGSLAPDSHAIHPGADDNGSGTAALLEVARRLVAYSHKHPLSRRILFILFTGEERGLLGSARYVRNPLVPLDKTIAMLNMDMVGRMKDHKLIVYGEDTAAEFPELLKRLNATYGFQLVLQPGGFGPSDHASFYAKHLPVLFFFTGTHSDYHRPTDTADKLNVPDMERVVQFVSDAAIALAQAERRPQFTESKVSEVHLSAQGDRPYFGSVPDFGRDESGYSISGVAKGGPAEKGGLKGGDTIIRFGDSKIGNLEDFDSALRKHQAGDKVAVWVKRGGEEVKLEVTLDPPR